MINTRDVSKIICEAVHLRTGISKNKIFVAYDPLSPEQTPSGLYVGVKVEHVGQHGKSGITIDDIDADTVNYQDSGMMILRARIEIVRGGSTNYMSLLNQLYINPNVQGLLLQNNLGFMSADTPVDITVTYNEAYEPRQYIYIYFSTIDTNNTTVNVGKSVEVTVDDTDSDNIIDTTVTADN